MRIFPCDHFASKGHGASVQISKKLCQISHLQDFHHFNSCAPNMRCVLMRLAFWSNNNRIWCTYSLLSSSFFEDMRSRDLKQLSKDNRQYVISAKTGGTMSLWECSNTTDRGTSHLTKKVPVSDRGFQQLLLNSRGLHIGAELPGESRG